MDFLYEYGMFLVKFGTIIGGVAIIAFFVVMMKMRSRGHEDGHLEIKHLNQKFDHAKLLLESATLPKQDFKKSEKAHKEKLKKG